MQTDKAEQRQNSAGQTGGTPHSGTATAKPVFAVAPMLDWTDRHCRYFYRQFSRRALLYTEMVVADAVLHGSRPRLLGFDAGEQPIALQLGGSDPQKLAQAARIGADFGYNEINLNVGCPSDRVQAGAFGACLMLEPDKVARAVEAMKQAVSLPITIKCRIGVGHEAGPELLDKFAAPVWAAGADGFWLHARNVWLEGLSPKENRDVPPLDYGRAYAFKLQHKDKFVGINGGITTLAAAKAHLEHMDGVMLGRAVYHNPALLAEVDNIIYGAPAQAVNYQAVIDAMAAYADAYCAGGGRLSHITRHMTGLFHGMKGARSWRQALSEKAVLPGADSAVLYEAFSHIDLTSAEAEASCPPAE